MADYKNEHLVEVVCGFQFPKDSDSWDNTYFGQFYDLIKVKGFDQKEPRKGFQITFDLNPQPIPTPPPFSSEMEDQVLFKNNNNQIILLGRGKISFHYLSNYPGWEIFRSEFIKPFIEIYKSLGLGTGPRLCHMIYINRFNILQEQNLSDYFTIVSPISKGFGQENSTSVHRTINSAHNLLITKLNAVLQNQSIMINLECGAVCQDISCMNSDDWIQQADKTHAPVKVFFDTIISETLKKEISCL